MGALSALIVCIVVSAEVAKGANPNYSYHVKIDDAAHANFQEKAETRKGPDAHGFYSVVEPNGALRTVQYTADDSGFNPTVTYSYGGASVYVNAKQGYGGTYAPAFVQDKRVQIVDKFVGPPPALNVQPFALPAPSFGLATTAPVVVPSPLRVAPAPQLIAQAHNVDYAPAYMPPVAAFQIHQHVAPVVQNTYLPPPVVQQHTYLPPPPQQAVFEVARPPPVYAPAYLPPPPAVLEVAKPPPFVAPAYLPPPRAVAVPVEPVRTYLPPPVAALPPPQVQYHVPVAVAPPPQQVVYETPVAPPPPAVIAVEKVVDTYAVPPTNTFIDASAPVYPEAIKVVDKIKSNYGPPNFVPGEPLSLAEFEAPAVVVKKPAKVHVTVAVPQPAPIRVVQPPPPVSYVQEQVYVQPQPVIQKQVITPAYVAPQPLAQYAGAIGYHTQSASPSAYAHSYGTQGFQVTSSRNFNKAVLPVPAVVQPLAVAQQGYHYAPPPAQVLQAAPVYAPAHAVAVAAPVAKLIQPSAPVAIAGRKQNPLTFAYSYDQGGAKVSHSYSGSGW